MDDPEFIHHKMSPLDFVYIHYQGQKQNKWRMPEKSDTSRDSITKGDYLRQALLLFILVGIYHEYVSSPKKEILLGLVDEVRRWENPYSITYLDFTTLDSETGLPVPGSQCCSGPGPFEPVTGRGHHLTTSFFGKLIWN